MAAEHLKSAALTNMTASPVVATDAAVHGGIVRSAGGTIVPTAAAEVNSTYRFCRVPSNARVRRVEITAADFSTAGVISLGLYAIDGGAAVDADLFATLDMAASTGIGQHTDVTFESGEYTIAEADLPLWKVLGLSADPQTWYDVAATVTTQFNGGQPMRVDVEYVL